MATLIEALQSALWLLADGSKGHPLSRFAKEVGDPPDLLVFQKPNEVGKLHSAYRDAGARIHQTCTFRANPLVENLAIKGKRLTLKEILELNTTAAELARDAIGSDAILCGNIGPTGRVLNISGGDLSEREAYWAFRSQAEVLHSGGHLDAWWIETMTDDTEAIQAALAARATAPLLPLIVTMSFDSNAVPVTDPKTSFGKTPKVFDHINDALIDASFHPIDVIGANCGRFDPITPEGPNGAIELAEEFKTLYPDRLVAMKLNAGQSRIKGTYVYEDPETDSSISRDAVVYDGTPEHMARYAVNMAQRGARIIGGCCGTEPQHIEAMAEALAMSI